MSTPPPLLHGLIVSYVMRHGPKKAVKALKKEWASLDGNGGLDNMR